MRSRIYLASEVVSDKENRRYESEESEGTKDARNDDLPLFFSRKVVHIFISKKERHGRLLIHAFKG